jgi:hypothetical protein
MLGAAVGASVGGAVGRGVLSSGRAVGWVVAMLGAAVAAGAADGSRGLAVALEGADAGVVADGEVAGATIGNPGKLPTGLVPTPSLLRLNAAKARATAIDGPSST